MDLDTYRALREHGIFDKVELIEGRLVMGDYQLALSPEQVRAARALGLEPRSFAALRSYVDAVLADEQALRE